MRNFIETKDGRKIWDMKTSPLLRSDHLGIKDAQCAETKDGRKIWDMKTSPPPQK